MMSVAQAQALFGATKQRASEVDVVSLDNALGRVLAVPVVSKIDIPPHDNSAMDGIAIALRHQREFSISQRVPAGIAPSALVAGTAARIFTGGVVPDGADTVVIQENCEFDDNGRVRVLSNPKLGDNIRPRGQDVKAGATVAHQGRVLSPVDVSLLSSIGVSSVQVFRRLKVVILATGDELVEPGQPLEIGQIYNSNSVLLSLLCRSAGCEVLHVHSVADTQAGTRSALRDAAKVADLIISSGGVSVGEEDHVKPAVEALGALDFWKINMKPGKPVAFGRVGDTVFLGLPGNPVSSFVVFQLLAMPLIKALQGATLEPLKPFKVESKFAKMGDSREEYLRVKLVESSANRWQAELFPNLSSGVLSSLSWADGLVRQRPNHDISEGDLVDFYPLKNSSLW